MLIIRQKLFFETTKEIEETKKNLNNLSKKVSSSVSNFKNKISNPKKLAESIKDSVTTSYGKIKKDPSIISKSLKGSGKKILKFIKKNPRDAAYITAGYTLPVIAGKLVSKKKGEKAGIATTATLTALPIGEAAVAIDHLSRSNEGKTAVKATGQVIKGIAKDISRKIIKRKL